MAYPIVVSKQGKEVKIEPCDLKMEYPTHEGKPLPPYGLNGNVYYFRLNTTEFKVIYARQLPSTTQTVAATFRLTEETPLIALPPRSVLVGQSREVFILPQDIVGVVSGIEFYTQQGLLFMGVNLEPAYKGRVHFTLYNPLPDEVEIYLNGSVGKVIFVQGG